MALKRAVNQLFGRYLLVTNTVSCGGLMALGDASVQAIERFVGEKKPFDWARAGRMLVIGSMFGPLDHVWYIFLERALPGARVATIIKKILFEQLVFSPPVYWLFFLGRLCTMGLALGPFNHVWYTFLDKILPGVACTVVARKILLDQIAASPFFAFTFFIGSGALEGQSTEQSWLEFKDKFWTVYKTDWMVWPAAQAINFYYLHPRYRVVYVAVITFGWNTFLSYIKHRDEDERKERNLSKQS